MSGCPFSFSRRGFLGVAGALAAAGAGFGVRSFIGGKDNGLSGSGASEPFWGRHQAGIATPAQNHTYFASFDLVTDKRDEVIKLLQKWTAASARMAQGLDAGQNAADGSPDSGDAQGLPPSRLTITFGFGSGLFVKRVPQRGPLLQRRPRFRVRPNASFANPAQSPLTTRQLAADYLNLCRSPLPDIQRWVAESRPAYTGANAGNLETWRTSHAQITSPGLARPANRFCGEPLYELRGRLDPLRAGGQCRRLSSRPGAGLYKYDQLRSLRAQTETSAAETHSLPSATSSQAIAPSSGLAGELAAAKGYYASRIAAARLTLSQAELALAIRAINDEQTLAARTIIQRWEGYFQNREQGTVQEPERPNSNRPMLRYPTLRKD